MTSIRLPRADGTSRSHTLRPPRAWSLPPAGAHFNRIAYAAAHVVADPLSSADPWLQSAIDWDSTLAYRSYLWSLGLGVAEAMDTAQRGMGLDWPASLELIDRSLELAHATPGARIACGAGTDHLEPRPSTTIDEVIAAYELQCEAIEARGGRIVLMERLAEDAMPLDLFIQSIEASPPTRVPGTAVFLTSTQNRVPHALLHNLKHNKVLHETNLFVTVKHHEVPWISFDRRSEMESLGHGCWQVTLHFGFKNEPDVPEALALLHNRSFQLNDMETSYFLSRDIVIPTLGSGMAGWREKLFAGMHRNASAAADYLSLPTNRVVELGSKVEI